MRTTYQYNTQNQLTASQSPDGGLTRYFYNPKGQLVLSQNQRQVNDMNTGYAPYSYTVFDKLGRVIEVGELYARVTGAGNMFYHLLTYEQQQNLAAQPGFPHKNVSSGAINWEIDYKQQVTRTQYSKPLSAQVSNYFGQNQQNLRGRIATVIYQEEYDTDSTLYDYALHFNYDIHGNVTTLITEDVHLKKINAHLKHLTYDYDLISGNVKKVSYQKGKTDSRYHKYTYDRDNRLKHVFTSTDDQYYEQDARYDYYEHGPLARTEIGELSIQGIDYVYNIQGWLKSMNSNTLDPERDPGKDGDYSNSYLTSQPDIHAKFARDVFGFSLGYFENDYKAIDPAKDNFIADESPLYPQFSPLYNGNISHGVTAITDENHNLLDVHLTRYNYDQLNRLKQVTAFSNNNDVLTTNSWAYSGGLPDYYTGITYDFNGNITNLTRNAQDDPGQGAGMDFMNYHYTAGTNQLEYVEDIAGQTRTIDYPGSTPGNFVYNEIGQLTEDASEEIEEIEWNVYGKVKSIIRTANSNRPDLEFRYDPFGNRIAKIEKPRDGSGLLPAEHWVYTHYTRDASGTSMAVYTTTHPDVATKEFVHSLKEQYLYGSKRLGTVNKLTQLHTHEYTGSFTGLANMVVNSSQVGLGFGGVITAPPTLEPVAGVQLSLTAGDTVLGSVEEDDITYSDALHQLCGQVNNHEDYDTLHTGLSNEIMILSTNFSNENELLLSYSTTTDDHYSVRQASSAPKTGVNHEFGFTQYELTNHLGNVQTTVSNRFLFGDSTPVKLADIYTYADYYAFGMLKPERYYNPDDYSRGFQGYLEDDEVKGVRNSYTTFYRQYDPRLARWTSTDPVIHSWETPYASMGNNPIVYVDNNGDFKTQFGAFLYKVTHGGGEIRQDLKSGEYYVGNDVSYEGEGMGASYQRSFKWSDPGVKRGATGLSDLGRYGTNKQVGSMLSRNSGLSYEQKLALMRSRVSASGNRFNDDPIGGLFADFMLTGMTAGIGVGASAGIRAMNAGKGIAGIRAAIAKGSNSFLRGGKTFSQFRSSYWATRAKPIFQPIRMSNGKVFKVHMELHHRFIPQRAKWAPNWLKNNRFNLQPLNTIQHGLRDRYRFRFFPKEIKNAINSGNKFGY